MTRNEFIREMAREVKADGGITFQQHDGYRLFVNDERTVLVRIWPSGVVEVVTRPEEGHVWGPPIRVREEYGA